MILTKVGGRLMPRILTKVGGRLMNNGSVLSRGAVIGFLLGLAWATSPPPASAAVGDALGTITPTAAGTTFVDPTCGNQGGTSLALVPGRKLAGVDPVLHPLVLVVSCLDNGASTIPARLNFINPDDGQVLKQLSTTAVPSNGWAHLVNRPDKGDLLGCGDNGALYSIDYSNVTSTPDGTATALTPLPSVATSCKGLAWDAEADTIYLGLSVGGGNKIGRVVAFKEGTTTLLKDFTNLPCAANGLAISGGTLLMSCEGALTILRLDKNTGVGLGANGVVTATGLPSLNPEPGLGDLVCDPVTFHKDANGKDLYTDALWSRRGANGNGVVALEFPAFTCGLPSSSVVVQNGVPFSPLAAGLSAPGPNGPGELPLSGCFDAAGDVKDSDGDGLPDCWETSGIDFDGDGTVDLQLCVMVDTNGDGVADTSECADPTKKDLFVEIDYMQFHKPDPPALSQTQIVASVGVKTVREAFAAAPVASVPGGAITGIRAHFQVDEQVTFPPLAGASTSHVNQVAFTPCTGPASAALDPAQAVDFDSVKAGNFGTAAERASGAKTLNAKRLAFRYVLFAHNLVGNPSGGSTGSGCAEVGGDDAVITLGSFASTTVEGVTHNRGLTDQQAGTFLHEVGHTLGLEHGGHDTINCKPNYLSVMSYSRQFAGSPILNRRLDYSSAKLPDLNEGALDEFEGLGDDPSLLPELPFFTSVDQTAFGPSAWSVVTGTGVACSPNSTCINWNRSKQGPNPTYQTAAAANLNQGPGGCDGSGTVLEGHDDWGNLRYRASAALDFAGGVRTDVPAQEITKEQEEELFLAADLDANGVGDGVDCGTFLCTHRIDIKPSFPFPKTLKLGAEANVTIAIFSEKVGSQVWSAPDQVIVNNLSNFPLTFRVESVVEPVKTNQSGQGTCSISDVEDPITGKKDGTKDLKCQFPTTGLPIGTFFGVLSGFFPDPLVGGLNREFSARQQITILP
jgi:hypothetical protein